MLKKIFSNKKTTITTCLILVTTLVTPHSVYSSAKNLITPHVKNEILVKLKSSPEIFKFKFANLSEMENLINYYSSLSEVEYAEPNFIYQSTLEPLDPYYTQQTYLTEIKAHLAWNITTGSKDVTIAILDSGVDIQHPDLKENLWVNLNEIPNNGIDDDENGFTDDYHGWDFVDNTNDPSPKLHDNYSTTAIKHGTVVAGVAAAQGGNHQGIAGVTWKAKIMPLRVLNHLGEGDTYTVAQAIDYARKQGAEIINLSFVGQGKSQTLENAIKNAYLAGIIVVAAAGNDVEKSVNLDLNPRYPVCHDGPNGENWVIGVGSIDNQNQLASFSNFGQKCIDIVAPGVGIVSTVFHHPSNPDFEKYYEAGWTGTSVSAPQISGAFALIKTLNPNLSADQIKSLVLNNAQNIAPYNLKFQNQLGRGKLDVYTALSKALLEKPATGFKFSNILATPSQNGNSHLRIYRKSNLEQQFFSFDENLKNDVSLAYADLEKDGQIEIVVGLGKKILPWVKIFNETGTLKHTFLAYHQNFRGGVEVATGDVDGDGQI